MNYLSGALRYVAGGESDSNDAVPRLIDRIKTSALPQDRRSAIIALTASAKFSPQRQVLVGELAIKVIYAVLEQDKDYDDTLKATLELLIAICGTLDPPPISDLPALLGEANDGINDQERLKQFENRSARAAATNVDVFLGLPNSVSLLLDLLGKNDFYVKFGTIELLTAMAANSRHTLQMAVLEAPQGVSRICDLLDDNHRHVRSNAVLLLSTLCDESPEICKIVAYGGVLEKLFALIEAVTGDTRNAVTGFDDDDDDEESLESSIVVQDVLLVLRNLIHGATTTRTFFRDTGCLPRLVNVVEKAAADANIQKEEANQSAQTSAASSSKGMKGAVEKQARKNLIVSMHCISGLVKDGDDESRQVKSVLAATNLFSLLTNLAFSAKAGQTPASGKLLENVLQVRVAALKTAAMLARGHDDFRSMFSSSSFSVSGDGDATTAQVAALRAMSRDPSSGLRVAAYSALRESFVVDAGLDLPSSNLLNAMTGSGGPAAYSVGERISGLRRNALSSSSDLASPGNAIQFIADSLKAALVGWPTDADAAGVFYAASLVTWVVDRVQGARERLLGSYVNGGSLLPQVIRVVGKLEREKGPPEVRIALFSLACTWLHGSPSAVSAFLTSAMHLPMLVDVLNSSGSRGDVAEVHVRGLAAVLLGICLQASDGTSEPGNDGGFLSGGGGASVVIPRGTVLDVIRNRIGVTVFTACLDDLRASKAFSGEGSDGKLWAFADKLITVEDRTGLLSSEGRLGHEQWYSSGVISVVNDVYKNVGARALDLISEQPQIPIRTGNGAVSTFAMNGHAGNAQALPVGQRNVLADSAKDEVLNSYKEFIRTQDENLNAARRQIEELATALRETQLELDAKANEASAAKDSDNLRTIREANEELIAQKEALEALLEEKSADFAALSDAYAALEEEHGNQSANALMNENAATEAEVADLRSQNAHVRDSLNAEVSKNVKLSRRAAFLDNTVKAKEAELDAMARERDLLKTGAQPDVAEALQWRTKAEVAEANLVSCQAMLNSMQSGMTSLEEQLRDTERSKDEAAFSMTTLQRKLQAAQLELDDLRLTRKRELQVSRESAQAANTAAQNEVARLKEQLAEALQVRTVQSVENSEMSSDEMKNYEALKRDHQALLASFGHLKTELLDTKSALTQWQRKGESTEAAKEREALENNRLSNLVRAMEGKVHTLNESLASQTQISSASTVRVSELERQSAELDEMRRRGEEESSTLREELAARTEQSIRLSGQLYEAEEAKLKVEEELQDLRGAMATMSEELERERTNSFTSSRDMTDVSKGSEEYRAKVAALEEDLEVMREALADSKDRESLSQAQARDRETAVAKAASLEQNLNEARAKEEQLLSDLNELRERLLSLDEAEEAKRALTMQVVSLQKSLAEAGEARGISQPKTNQLLESEERVKHLQTQVSEKDMRLKELEASLTAALDRADVSEREKSDLTKQISELEAMLSVLTAERDDLLTRCEDLKGKLDEKAPLSKLDSAVLQELQKKLALSEENRIAASNELTSLVDACRLSEQETSKVREDNETLQSKVLAFEKQFDLLKKESEDLSLSQEVERIISSVVLESVVSATLDVSADSLSVIRHERDAALALQAQALKDLESVRAEMAGLEVALRDRDEIISASSHQAEQLTHLTARLADMEAVAQERDQLAKTLEVANASVKTLNEERNALIRTRVDAEPLTGATTDTAYEAREPSDSVSSSTHKRVIELEDALRDAARTVSATNLELISAQALLVELSADKTAIRTELNAAQEQIQTLNARLSVESRSQPAESALSEVSEQEQPFSDVPPDPRTALAIQEVSEQCLKTANAETENLRTALQRSISEAQSAFSLLTTIDVKVGQVEERLRASQTSLLESKTAEKKLGNDLGKLQGSYEVEKASYLKDIDTLQSEIQNARQNADDTSRELNEKLKTLEGAREAERENLQAAISEKENIVDNIRKKSADLQVELDNAIRNVKDLSEQTDALEKSNSAYAAAVASLEDTVASTSKHLVECESREESLRVSLQQSNAELRSNKEAFAKERAELKEEHKAEVEEYEAEVDRAAGALEDAERKFRDAETSLKGRIAALEDRLRATTGELVSSRTDLQSNIAKLATIVSEKANVEAKLSETLRENTKTISTLTKERDEAQCAMGKTVAERDAKQKSLLEVRGALERTKAELREEGEQKAMLESENQDFLSSIESLEVSAKRLRDDLAQVQTELEASRQNVKDSEKVVTERGQQLEGLQEQLRVSENDIKQLRKARAKLEDETDRLRESLDAADSAREIVEQDNSDLKAWVADLERQATELQSAAEQFEEVEQSLREALDTQRDVVEQNAELSEDLKKEREALANAEAQVRSALRDKNAAESARESSQRRANDLEARIREIREEHVVKVSHSEDAIRAKARRCAELETDLASTERKLAELASVSDSLFGAKAELQQRDEEIKTLRERSASAEERAEELQMQLQSIESEVSEMRESVNGDAYRSLEAEHNELLVCLADLELECTTLKEELGRE